MNKSKASLGTSLPKLAMLFAIITMAITWMLWWAIAIANQFGYLKNGTPLMMTLFMLGGLTPALVSVSLLIKTRQTTKKQVFKNIFNVKQPILLYAIAIIIPVASFISLWLVGSAKLNAPLYMPLLMLPVSLIGGGLEEIGWRYLFQPAIEKKTKFIFATLITSLIWALWHLPLFFIVGTTQSAWNFGVFTILTVGMSFILAAIRKKSNSAWLCILFHTVWNAMAESIVLDMALLPIILLSLALVIVALLIIKFMPNRTCKANTDKQTTTKEDFFRILDILQRNQITYWIEGGWGVDVLIGNQTRTHRDIDVDFDSKHQEKLVTILKEIGYQIVTDELPVRAELYHKDYGYLDIHPFLISHDGSVKQCSPDSGYFEFDKNWFTVSNFEGRKIPCYTKEAQNLFHSGYDLRETDIQDLENLKKNELI